MLPLDGTPTELRFLYYVATSPLLSSAELLGWQKEVPERPRGLCPEVGWNG